MDWLDRALLYALVGGQVVLALRVRQVIQRQRLIEEEREAEAEVPYCPGPLDWIALQVGGWKRWVGEKISVRH